MPRPQLSQLRTLSPASSYRWNISFSGDGATTIGAIDNGINLRAISSSLPKKTNEPQDMRIRGHHIVKPGVSDSSGQITLTVHETVDNYMSNVIKAWSDLAWSEDFGTSVSDADMNVVIILQRLDRTDTPIYEYKLFGCFLADYDLTTLEGVNGTLNPSLTIQYSGFSQGVATI